MPCRKTHGTVERYNACTHPDHQHPTKEQAMTPTVAQLHPSSECPCTDCRKVWAMLSVGVEGKALYVSGNGDGLCHRCGFREDLRMGTCFKCSDFVGGIDHGDGIHELFDRTNPTNRWVISWK